MLSSVDAKLLKSTKFPPEFDKKVDVTKIDIKVIKIWIASRISQILDDEVVIDLCYNLLEESRFPDIKKIQIQLTGFLDKDAALFCKELWNLCLSAQASENGIPEHLLQAKIEELRQKSIQAKSNAEQTQRRVDDDRARQNRWSQGRPRERGPHQGPDQVRSGGEAGRYRSRSPPRRRGRKEGDSYVPQDSIIRRNDANNRHGRSRSPVRSASPDSRPPVDRSRRRGRRRSVSSSSRDRSKSPPPSSRGRDRRTDRSPDRGDSRSRSPSPGRRRPSRRSRHSTARGGHRTPSPDQTPSPRSHRSTHRRRQRSLSSSHHSPNRTEDRRSRRGRTPSLDRMAGQNDEAPGKRMDRSRSPSRPRSSSPSSSSEYERSRKRDRSRTHSPDKYKRQRSR